LGPKERKEDAKCAKIFVLNFFAFFASRLRPLRRQKNRAASCPENRVEVV